MNDRGVLVEGLKKSFGDFQALNGLDLAVAEGTVGGLLGPNGSGKTTTIRILSTLLDADGGAAFVGGYNVAADPHSVRSVISLTGQYAAVDSDLTGRQNLIMIARLCRYDRAGAKRRADELLGQFDLEAAATRLVRTYSGGMRRRLDLAASLVLAPRVLFLDEPTTGLDPPNREELWNVVRSLRDGGTTIVLTTQYLEEADRLADYITVIDQGRAVAHGTAADLKAKTSGDVIELHSTRVGSADRAGLFMAAKMGIDPESVTPGGSSGPALITIASGSMTVVDAVRLLDAEGFHMDDIRLRRASLDEVFTTLTGRSEVAK
jgi:ABC-2 type transport system ATP-binding protein